MIPGQGTKIRHAVQCGKIIIRLPRWLSGGASSGESRRHRFNPWSEKIPHAVGQLSPCATTVQPVLKSPGTTTTDPVCHNY